MPDTPALRDAATRDLDHDVVEFGRVQSAEEAAAAQNIELGRLIKTLVVRRSDDDYVFVLVPGDRSLDWPKLRAFLGVSRMSLPDAAEAQAVTGYARGTITPFGSHRSLPVICDERLQGSENVAIGGGAHGVSIHVRGDDLVAALGASLADVTKPG